MFKLFSIVFVAFFVQGALSQEILDGQCPEVTLIENFDYTALAGHWLGLERFPEFTPILNNTKCAEADYSIVGDSITVVGSGIDLTSGSAVSATYNVQALTGGAVIAPLVPNANTVNAWVLNDEFSQFVSIFGCINISADQYARIGWILVRDLNLAQEYKTEARNAFNAVNFNADVFLPYDQSNCAAN